ncbi:MAG: ThiF family adenylyltransferase [Oscillospiraceae bacterium]|nr:ThiF family adenylyltransferase [Oscillospiraceae bacterium]
MDSLNLSKSNDFFKPEEVTERIHIIGCGSVGPTVVELLARFGLTNLTLYDFDTVEPKNLANQMFRQEHVGKLKVTALVEMLCEINPEIRENVVVESLYRVADFRFCVSLRRQHRASEENRRGKQGNPYIKAMFDFRTRLTDTQHYAADWSDMKSVDDFIRSMDFTHDEAKEETPVSACNVTLSVAPTIRTICSLGVANFVNFV